MQTVARTCGSMEIGADPKSFRHGLGVCQGSFNPPAKTGMIGSRPVGGQEGESHAYLARPAPRSRAATGFLLAALLLTSSASAEPEGTKDLTIDQKYVAEFAVAASDLKVTTWVDHKDDTYRVGDTLKLFVKTNRDAFITVVDVGTSGKVVVLFPNKHASDNRIGADKVLEIPGPKAPYDIRVSGPAGQELIKVIATTRPGSIIRADQLSELGPFQSYSGSAESFTKDLAIELKPNAPNAPPAASDAPKDATVHKVIRIVAQQGPTAAPQPQTGGPSPPSASPNQPVPSPNQPGAQAPPYAGVSASATNRGHKLPCYRGVGHSTLLRRHRADVQVASGARSASSRWPTSCPCYC